MNDLHVGVDIGGTKIQVVAVREGSVIASHRTSTPAAGVRELVGAIAEGIDKVLAGSGAAVADVRGIGVGVPGAVDVAAGTVASANNVPGLEPSEPTPLAELVSRAAGAPVRLENDAHVATLGEWTRGAGRPYRDFLTVWVGTGVGGGLVLDGKLHEGQGAAGEIGHLVIKPGGRVCSDGRRGHLEAYAGRGRMEARARSLLKAGRKTVLFDLMEKKRRTRLTSGVIADALERGDKVAHELVDDAVWALGLAIASVQNLLALQAVVIGGGLGDRLGAPFIERIAAEMQSQLFVPDRPPTILGTEFGDLSGAVGAAVLVGA
ncbi:MAG TPA: ROK family protein [Actinomycetota bacterium]|nr:ROK family protein [Actinomycetota bacterium]